MESNTINDSNSKLNDYITESFKGTYKYLTKKMTGVYSLNFFLNLILFNYFT